MDTPLTNLNGDAFYPPGSSEPVKVNQVLANVLSGNTKGIEPIKAMDWAYKLYNDGIIKVDNADFEKLKGFVSNSDAFSNIQIFQILKAMDNFTEEDDAKKEEAKEGT